MANKILIIGTNNEGKFKEIKEILKNIPFKLKMPKDLGITKQPKETGKTYKENAIIKAKFYAKKTGLNTLAEDSGIEIQAFPNQFGHKTRRWGAGEKATDTEWLNYFMNKIKSKKNKKAEFICCCAVIINEKLKTFTGKCKGKITDKIETKILKGLPLSSVFKPHNEKKVYAALSKAQKNKISHRGKAISKAKITLLKMSTRELPN